MTTRRSFFKTCFGAVATMIGLRQSLSETTDKVEFRVHESVTIRNVGFRFGKVAKTGGSGLTLSVVR
jgi:hypothetical protein